jgi:hypothetical protein
VAMTQPRGPAFGALEYGAIEANGEEHGVLAVEFFVQRQFHLVFGESDW